MSSFRGLPDPPWPLARAVGAMRDAARAAGRPALVWIAGILYPALEVGLSATLQLGGNDRGHGVQIAEDGALAFVLVLLFGGGILLVALLPIFGRLMAGLARLAPPRIWEQLAGPRGAPSLRTVWQAGRGLTLPAVGLWVLLGVLYRGALIAVLALVPAVTRIDSGAGGTALASLSWLVLVGPAIALVGFYALVISVLHQLALHSLAHNRRGVASALVHAWRIARNDPWATARTVAVDFVLCASVLLLALAAVAILGRSYLGTLSVGMVVSLVLGGFAGVTRAGYWARAYRALGGLSPDDGVPGL